MRVADYIMKYLADIGVNHIFTVVGGGSMHLNDALKKEKRIKYVCCHHEQACAFAAEGYARVNNKLGVVLVTSGPGATNCITGVAGQWTDSIPVLYISGQVKRSEMITGRIRQRGDQEINILDIVRDITKSAVLMTIKIQLEQIIRVATTGRFGPVWLDVPLDVQREEIC